MSRNEENTKYRLIQPKLHVAGWGEFDWQIHMEYSITAGRIHWDGKSSRRARPVYADYLLRYKPAVALAVVEAKSSEVHHLEGSAQAKDYAQKLGLWFAYSTNGHQIEFFDLKANTQQTVERFHTPDELWHLYLKHAGIGETPANLNALTQNYYDESSIGQRRSPRYYQEKAVRAALEAILRGGKRVLITQATGTGKTFTSMQLVYKLVKSRVAKKVLFIVDRNLLADQAFNDFNNAMDKDACYRLSPKDEKFPLGRDLYFGIYQSLVGEDDEGGSEGRADRYKEFPPDFFDLIVIDEAHRGGANQAGSWFRLLEYFKSAVQVGLTATPKREDSNDTYRYFGSPVVNYSLKDGIQDGFLSPYILKRVTSNIDALGYRPEHSDIKDVRGRTLPTDDYFTPDFERKLSIPERTRAFAYHLIRHLFATDPLGKTMVFCVDQQHALDMAKYVQEAFLLQKQKYGFDYNGVYAVRITGDDKDNSGKYPMLERFVDLESNEPIVVTTSKLLTTGIDVKSLKNVVLFRNIGSMVEFKQIIGRGTRVYEHPDKAREKLGFYILEYANFSTELFNDPDWDDEPIDVVNEGSIDVADDEESKAADTEGSENEPVPAATQEDPARVDAQGLYVEKDEAEAERIRYRMSEDFLRGNVSMVAESLAFTGEDGRPLSAEQFVVYQADVAKRAFGTLESFTTQWQDGKYRREFIEGAATALGLNIETLTHIFFQRKSVRNVDTLDVLAHLLFGARWVTKVQRVADASAQLDALLGSMNPATKAVVDDILSVYLEMDFQPFFSSKELWQTPNLRRHGSINEIQALLGGPERLKAVLDAIQTSLYQERKAA